MEVVGKTLRKQVPRSIHGEWSPAADRTDPVTQLEQENEDPLPWLVVGVAVTFLFQVKPGDGSGD